MLYRIVLCSLHQRQSSNRSKLWHLKIISKLPLHSLHRAKAKTCEVSWKLHESTRRQAHIGVNIGSDWDVFFFFSSLNPLFYRVNTFSTLHFSFYSNFCCFLLYFIDTAYVKSNTVVGDSKHSTGVVLAEIVRANIPVKNGVVHLIHRPLMVVDTTVKQFLEVWFHLNTIIRICMCLYTYLFIYLFSLCPRFVIRILCWHFVLSFELLRSNKRCRCILFYFIQIYQPRINFPSKRSD